MKKLNFTAIDFETATSDRMPCQLGIVVVRGGEISEEKSMLIKPPQNKYNFHNTRIHGINSEKTKDIPEFDELWPEIKPYFDQEMIVSHNIDFDMNVLNNAISYYDLVECRHLGERCTMRIYNNRSLKDISVAVGIEMTKHHDALSDARTCAEIFIKFMNGLNPDKLEFPIKENTQSTYTHYNNQRIKGEIMIQDLSIVENPNTIFFNKKIVISGVFERFQIRNDLGLLLKKLGADINTCISRKTDIFIIASEFGPSKMNKVLELKDDGYDIQILEETQLYKILDSIQ